MWGKVAITAASRLNFSKEVAIILGTLIFMVFLAVMSPAIIAGQTVKSISDGVSAIFNPETYTFTFKDENGNTVETVDAKTQWPTSGTTDNGARGFFATRTINGVVMQHNAIDISNNAGTPVYAFMDGTVSRTGNFLYGCGPYCLFIDHGGGIKSRYAHMQALHVKKGDFVKRGTLVGDMGSEGFSTGPHLDFAVFINGKPANPRDFLKGLPPR